MRRRCGLVVVVAILMAASTAGVATAGGRTKTVFSARSREGQVWVSVDIALHRTKEPFIPLAVAVYNTSRQSIVLNHDSFWLVGTDGVAHKMPTIPELRKRYHKQSFDLTMVRLYGMPFGTRLDLEYLVPSNFFPLVENGSEGVRIQRVELPQFYWTVDLLYFSRPAGLAKGEPVTLVVAPKGWDTPLHVKLSVRAGATG